MITNNERIIRCIKYTISLFIIFSPTVVTCAGTLVASNNYSKKIPEFEVIGRLQIIDINNKNIDISQMKGKTILFVFFDPLNITHKESISYTQVLYRKYHQDGFEVIGISSRDMSATRELFAFGKYSFPFVSDEKGTIYEKYQMKSCCGGVVFINKKTEVVFKFPSLLISEDLRQLAEKEIFGKISYSFKPIDPVNDEIRKNKIPSLPLIDIAASRVTDLKSMKQKPYIVTFFSAFCPICKSGKRIETLKRLREKWIKEGKNIDILLVFSKPYMDRDIQEIENKMGLPFGKFISMEDIFTEEEKYITDDSLKLDPLTVVINQDRSMVFMEHMGMKEAEIGTLIANIFDNK